MMALLRRVLRGPDGLRVPWRIILFLALFGIVLVSQLVAIAIGLGAFDPHFLSMLKSYRHMPGGMVPSFVLLQEIPTLIAYFAAVGVLARIERRRVRDYFLAGRARIRLAISGFFWGFVFLSLLIGILSLDGKITISLADHGAASILDNGTVWLVACCSIAFAEENLFRGYLLFTLERAIWFWPAAILLAIGFGLAHGTNPGETPIGEIFAGLYALAIALSIYYTRSLWWAVGYHAAWDWSESYFYGTADSGMISHGRLLASVPRGDIYLSGGPTGPEGSLFALIPIAATVVIIWLTLRNSPVPAAKLRLAQDQPLG